jgi:hypothetical protein
VRQSDGLEHVPPPLVEPESAAASDPESEPDDVAPESGYASAPGARASSLPSASVLPVASAAGESIGDVSAADPPLASSGEDESKGPTTASASGDPGGLPEQETKPAANSVAETNNEALLLT